MQTDERITTELVREFVMAAHGDLERVQELLANHQAYFMLLIIGVAQIGKVP